VGSPRSCWGAPTEATSGLPRYLALILSSVQDRTDLIPFSVRERARPTGGGPCAGRLVAAFLRAVRVRWGGRVPRPTHGHRLGAGPTGAPAAVFAQHGPVPSLSDALACSFPVLFSSVVLVVFLEICCVGRFLFLWISCLHCPFSWHTPLPSHLMLGPTVSSSQSPRTYCHLLSSSLSCSCHVC